MNQRNTGERFMELIDALPASVIFGVAGLLGLMVRLIVLEQIKTDPHIERISGDGAYYLGWAHSIAQGQWIGRDVFYPSPLYPYCVAAFQRFFSGQIQSLLMLQAIVGAAGCGLLALATKTLFNPRAGLLAGALLAFYPAAISYDLQVDKTVLDVPLTALTLVCIACGLRSPRRRWWFACGLSLGVFSLTRENALALTVPIIAWLWWTFRSESRRRRTGFTATMVLGIFLAIFPVCLRNSLLGGGFYLSTAKFGANFYYGNAARADGIYFPLRPGRGDLRYEQTDATEIAEQAVGRPLSIGEVSHWWTQRTLREMAEAPGRWAWLSVKKFALFFCDTEIADADVHERHIVFSSALRGLDQLWGFRIVLVFAAAGAVLLFRTRKQVVSLLVALTVAYAAAIAVFIVFGRYRLPVVPLLLPLAAGGLVQLPTELRQRRWLRLTGACTSASAAALLVWAGERSIPQRIAGANPYNRANLFAELNRPELAIADYRLAISQSPTLAAAYTNLSLQLTAVGRLAESQGAASRAVELEPGDAAAHTNLGLVLARQHLWSAAVGEFREALRIDPRQTAAKQNLSLAEHLATQPTSP